MRRIMVVGASAGAGKSTFARSLSKQLNIPVYHLDTFYWKPGWEEEDTQIFREKQQKIVGDEYWIIEGNYSSTFDIRLEKADTIIFLDQPLWVCLYRVFKRRVMYRKKSRPDLTEGCPEKIDFAFLSFIVRTYYPRKKKMREKLQTFKDKSSSHQVYLLSGDTDTEKFLDKVHKGDVE
ncbi:P-loop NTPase family protein [Alkalicoccobacillus murimartini]|uniref:Adenylate kinase family enzyme n=1 Tax=Alkalicoccobacillus murimartini TaxID=171685 RepID=A0ABT9YLB6_9BACI|nr:topology modulation protein [Alkalicoccobacillus murimartini]MDQ0207824.1 adenylate kinase family enzyme [Alkalicoccobacillus murimartini]